MEPILSICISTYNRPKEILDNINNLLSCHSDAFEVVVQDCSSNNETYDLIKHIQDNRLKYKKKDTTGSSMDVVMDNWKTVLLLGTGKYVFCLNDRDYVNPIELSRFIDFLNRNNTTLGGVCKRRILGGGAIYGLNGYQSFLKIPYNAYHITGIIFDRKSIHEMVNFSEIFTVTKCYIHPHDLVLGELSTKGSLFNYSRKLWKIADTESFKNNASYLHGTDKDIEDFWFSPSKRFLEYKLFIEHLNTLNIPIDVKKKKITEISKRYMYFTVVDYPYYLNDEGQSQHYGYQQKRMSNKEKKTLKDIFIENCTDYLRESNLDVDIKEIKGILDAYYYKLHIMMPIWRFIKAIRGIR